MEYVSNEEFNAVVEKARATAKQEPTDIRSYRDLEPGTANFLVPPRVQAMLTGVKFAKQLSDGTIVLTYSDNSEESALLPDMELSTEDNFFAVVSRVQDKARNG